MLNKIENGAIFLNKGVFTPLDLEELRPYLLKRMKAEEVKEALTKINAVCYGDPGVRTIITIVDSNQVVYLKRTLLEIYTGANKRRQYQRFLQLNMRS